MNIAWLRKRVWTPVFETGGKVTFGDGQAATWRNEGHMAIGRLRLQKFTAFEELDFRPSRGINVLVGANGTGKTHLMKVVYAACDVSKTGGSFAEKLTRVFMPSGGSIGRLVKRRGKSSNCSVRVARSGLGLRLAFSNHAKEPSSARVTGMSRWKAEPVESVYIPVKEMLANAHGFRSLYAQRELHFEEIYDDILARAYKPVLRGPIGQERERDCSPPYGRRLPARSPSRTRNSFSEAGKATWSLRCLPRGCASWACSGF